MVKSKTAAGRPDGQGGSTAKYSNESLRCVLQMKMKNVLRC